MADENLLGRRRVTYIGTEAAFGTTPSGSFPNAMGRIYPLGEDIAIEPATAMHEVLDERPRRGESIDPVVGLQLETPVNMAVNLKAVKASPDGQLILGATPAALVPRVLLTHHYGVEHADEGGEIASAASGVSFSVGSGEGAHFKVGSWILVEVAGEMEPTMVTAISTDALTVAPDLSATPQAGDIVRNLYNYCRKEVHQHSLTVQQAFAGSTVAQYTVNGVHGAIEWNFPEHGELPQMSFSGMGTSWTGPSAQSLSVARVDDGMGAPGVWRPTVLLAASPARGTRLVCEGAIKVDSSPEWEQVREGGAANTVLEVINTGGRPRGPVITVTVRHNADWIAAFTARTALKMHIIHKIGTGLTAGFWLWDYPVVRLIAPPKPVKVGERLYLELTLHGTHDTAISTTGLTGDDLDRALACERVAFG
jgi:hypothetical protein